MSPGGSAAVLAMPVAGFLLGKRTDADVQKRARDPGLRPSLRDFGAPDFVFARPAAQLGYVAAVRITSSTKLGFESMGTWLASTS
jgi:hypothetical protein